MATSRQSGAAAGVPPAEICAHGFRGTGITEYLRNGGDLEVAARIAGHESTRTTQLYNRFKGGGSPSPSTLRTALGGETAAADRRSSPSRSCSARRITRPRSRTTRRSNGRWSRSGRRRIFPCAWPWYASGSQREPAVDHALAETRSLRERRISSFLGSTKKCGGQVDALMGVSVSGPRSRQDRWPSEAAPAAWPHTFWNSPKPVT